MASNLFQSLRWTAGLCLCLVLGVAGCGTAGNSLLPQTSVAALPGEDLAGPCTYSLLLSKGATAANGQVPAPVLQTGVLVIFERGDSLALFNDPTVIATAQQMHLAILYAYQCNASSFDDLQADASAGPGRALFQALNQFAVSLNHPELAHANVFLTGFSAAGFLSVTTAAEYPGRVLGTIPYAPGSAHFNLNDVQVSAAAAKVPSLILVSATDISAGDQLPFFLFRRGWTRGASWGFAAQHGLNHCCVDSIAPLLNPWITAVYNGYTRVEPDGTAAPKAMSLPAPATVNFEIAVDGTFDGLGWQDFYFGSYAVLPATDGGPYQAWLPDETATQAWVSWISAPRGN